VLALCLLGLAAAVGLLTARARFATAAVILGAALGGAAAVYADYRQAVSVCLPRVASSCTTHITYYRAGWVSPTALGLVVLGGALAAGVLVTARRGLLTSHLLGGHSGTLAQARIPRQV